MELKLLAGPSFSRGKLSKTPQPHPPPYLPPMTIHRIICYHQSLPLFKKLKLNTRCHIPSQGSCGMDPRLLQSQVISEGDLFCSGEMRRWKCLKPVCIFDGPKEPCPLGFSIAASAIFTSPVNLIQMVGVMKLRGPPLISKSRAKSKGK